MIKVSEIAKELSIKLGDPRVDNGDGIIFFGEDKLRYVSRAYGKLIRILSMAMRKYKPGFVLPLVPMESKAGDSSSTPTLNKPFIELEEVIVTLSDGKEKVVASKLDPRNYNQTRFGLNTINKPSLEKKNIFFCVINQKLYLLPEVAKYGIVYAMGVEDLPSELTLDYELPLDRTYADLLVTLAAIEAMNDLPNPQKVGLYRQELLDQISVITAYSNLMERREGETGNG